MTILIILILAGLLALLMYAIIAYIRDIGRDYGYSYDTVCETCGALNADRGKGFCCAYCRSLMRKEGNGVK